MLVRGLMDPLAAIRRLDIGMHSFQKSHGLQSSKTGRRRNCAKGFHAKQRHVLVPSARLELHCFSHSPYRPPAHPPGNADLQMLYVGLPLSATWKSAWGWVREPPASTLARRLAVMRQALARWPQGLLKHYHRQNQDHSIVPGS